jgi:hypothetical protein
LALLGLFLAAIVVEETIRFRRKRGWYRDCPRCGMKVIRGDLDCPHCGMDFRTIGS